MELKVGDLAPNFSLLDQNGNNHKLGDHRGDWVFLFFYPKDLTPGCTKEVCGIRDNFSGFKKRGVKVFGISKDSVMSHKKFEQKYRLPFTLLSDPDGGVLKDYGVWQRKKMMGKEYYGIVRTSFLLDPEGKIARIYPKVKPGSHGRQVLEDLYPLS